MRKYTYIDLFAGCGGLSLGLFKAGWHGLFAVEKDPLAFETLRSNLIEKLNHFDWPDWLEQKNHNIRSLLVSKKKCLIKLRNRVDMIVGGPPCQGFSIAGQRDHKDDRNKLINSYIKFVSIVKPKIIFFENVKGFTMEFKNNESKGKKYSQIVTNKLTLAGYNVFGKLVDFGEYGIPQKRIRFILVGIRKDLQYSSVMQAQSFFDILQENKFDFLQKKNIPSNPTVQDALIDLVSNDNFVETPDRKKFKSCLYNEHTSRYQQFIKDNITDVIPNSHSFAKHSIKIKERLKFIQKISSKSKNISDTIKEELGIKKQVLIPLQANEQSPTITSHPDDMIHYCEPRILTVRECARLQSFPDSFEFKGKYTTGGKLRRIEVPRYTQVANAIPPLFSEQVGIVLKDMI